MSDQKDISYYRRLPYRRRVRVEEDSTGPEYFVAWIEEIPWIEADAETREEALRKLDETFGDAIEAMLSNQDEIAEPELWPGSAGGGLKFSASTRKILGFARRKESRAAVVETSEKTVEQASPAPEWDHVESTDVQTMGAGV